MVDTKIQTSYHRWQGARGGPIVLMADGIISDIRDHIFTGFRASPRPGAEMGGALLGAISADGREIVVDEFEPLQIEHKFGTPYILSENDYAQWHQWLRALRQAFPRLVGICRSHTRPGLRVAPEDNLLIKQFMAGEQGVLLLVKPLSDRDCVGALYPFSNGQILNGATTSEEFPFGSAPRDIAAADSPAVPKSRPWIPITAVIAGMGAALALHCSSDSSRENPVSSAAPHASVQYPKAAVAKPPAVTASDTTPALYDDGERSGRTRKLEDDESSVPPPKPTVKWSVPPPGAPPAATTAKVENPPPGINSSSEKTEAKPATSTRASAASEDQDSVRVRARLAPAHQEPATAIRSQGQGRFRRMVDGLTTKATHLWPFHSDKQEQPIQ